MTKSILVLGSTGSIGTQTLEVIASAPERFHLAGIAAAGSNPDVIVKQAHEFSLDPRHIAVRDEAAAAQVSQALGASVLSGPDAIVELIATISADTVVNALVGAAGLDATLATLDSGATLALANKESLVAGGSLVMGRAQPHQIVPVDSEHSAMAQCLWAGDRGEVASFVLTASGGPFRGWSRADMWDVTPQQAAAHPTWNMGQMNTLNSATLVNKGLELIEASLLFDVAPQDIEVVVHPQSIVHSMITFCDGATIAQASPPSMKLPISLALDWPHRLPQAQPALKFRNPMSWDFEPVDAFAFPAVDLAREVATTGGCYPAIYNAANEVAAEAFLSGKIHFPEIVDVVSNVVGRAYLFAESPREISDIIRCDQIARAEAEQQVATLMAQD